MKKIIQIFQYFKLCDWVFLAVSIATVCFSAYSLSTMSEPAFVVIENGSNSWVYSLENTQEIAIEGILGKTLIHIQNKSVDFLDSPCPHKTCIASPAITKSNQWIACLPNGVFAYIEGLEPSHEFDVISH